MNALQRKKMQEQEEKRKIIDRTYADISKIGYTKAVEKALEEMEVLILKDYKKKASRIREDSGLMAISIIINETMYEFAKQTGYFETDDEYIKESVKARIQEMFKNIMDSIKHYDEENNDSKARQEFEEKRRIISKEFNIKA